MFNCFISAQAQQMTDEANAQKPLISLKSVNINFSQNSKSLKAIYLYIEIRTLKVFKKNSQFQFTCVLTLFQLPCGYVSFF